MIAVSEILTGMGNCVLMAFPNSHTMVDSNYSVWLIIFLFNILPLLFQKKCVMFLNKKTKCPNIKGRGVDSTLIELEPRLRKRLGVKNQICHT